MGCAIAGYVRRLRINNSQSERRPNEYCRKGVQHPVLHDALQDARDHGDPIDGDISEEALIKEIESQESGLKVQGSDGCSTPKASKALTKEYDNIFLSVCNKHDACYAPYSNTNRKDCDNQFGKDMNKICMKTPIGEQSQCLRMATIYKAGVRAGGKSSYKGKGKNN